MATAREESWQIKRRSDLCAGTSRPFTDKETIMTRLQLKDGEYAREDFSLDYWKEHCPDHGISAWKSIYREPPTAEDPVQKESVESLLRKLVAREDPADINAIYILAVMLERKKILAEKEIRTDAGEVKIRVYEHKKSGETFLVIDPGLRLAEIAKVQDEVVGLLGGKPPKTETVYQFEAVLHSLIEKHEKVLFPKRAIGGEEGIAQKLAASCLSLLAGKKCPYWEESGKIFNRFEDSETWGPAVTAYHDLIEKITQEVRFQGLERLALCRQLETLAIKEPKELEATELLELFSADDPRMNGLRETLLVAVRTATAASNGQ